MESERTKPAVFNEDGTYNTSSHTYQGVNFPWIAAAASVKAVKTFEVRPDDIWIITYPKSGTTWTTDIINKLLLKSGIGGNPDPAADHAPYVEFHFLPTPNYELLAEAPSPRLITCHVPPSMLPTQLFEKKPRIVHVARNPKDVCVSYFYHFEVVPILETCESLDKYVDDFINGKIQFGDWADHEIFWWKKRNEENVLFLRFEEMKKDLKSSVMKLNDLLGTNLSSEDIKSIAEETSLEATKNRKERPKDFLLRVFEITKEKSPFVRDGKVGSWKQQFTVAQNEKFDEWYKRISKGHDLPFDL